MLYPAKPRAILSFSLIGARCIRVRCIPVGVTSLSLVFSLTSCTFTSSIQNVRQHPHRNWFNVNVYLQGTVGDRAPLIGGQVYQLRDNTGEVWVLTRQQTPKTGDRIRIKGQVKFESVPIEGLELGEVYVKEEQQLQPE